MAFELTKLSSYRIVIIIYAPYLSILQYLHKWMLNTINYVSYYCLSKNVTSEMKELDDY